VSDILNHVKIDIRQDGTGGFTDAEILSFIQEGYVDFCRKTMAHEKMTTAPVASFNPIVSLPVDFLQGRQTRWSYNMLLYPKTQRQLYYDVRDWPFQANNKPINIVYWDKDSVRVYPIPTVAGTITFRFSYVPQTTLQLTDIPSFPSVWHSALIYFADAECFNAQRKYDNADEFWGKYVEMRSKAMMQFHVGQRTPDTLQGMRPKTNFNWQYWNQRTT
jgi:hypothetical protein